MNRHRPANDTAISAFTLRELIVVIAVLSVLGGTLLTALHQRASWQIKKAQCAANLRQFAQACQLYAHDNRNRLPVLAGIGAWAWDIPSPAAEALLGYGMEKRTFYCPGTSPHFTDKENWAGGGANSTLWNFGTSVGFHIVSYAFAFSGSASKLALTNQNTTILPERTTVGSSTTSPPLSSERVLLADATISENLTGTAANPAPAGSFTSIAGGFAVNGVGIPHLSPHLNGNLPAGGNLAFKDGHVAWRKFAEMSQRASSGPGFWW